LGAEGEVLPRDRRLSEGLTWVLHTVLLLRLSRWLLSRVTGLLVLLIQLTYGLKTSSVEAQYPTYIINTE